MRQRRSSTGFSLIELMVVIAIIAILLSLATLNFNQWQRKSQIERQTRELMADLNTARTESIYRKQSHALIMNTDGLGYILRRYSSPDEKRTSTVQPAEIILNKGVHYQFTKGSGSSIGDRIFQFDITGFTNDWDTIRVNPVGSGAAFDCVVVSASRINIGQMSGGTCVQN